MFIRVVEMATLSLDQQIDALAERGVPIDDATLSDLDPGAIPTTERSVLVLSRHVLPVAAAAAKVERRERPVVLGQLEPDDLEGFTPIDAVEVPEGAAYLAVDVDLGASSRNVTPEDALREILAAGRSPLTIDEGVALVLQQPEVIATNWGFSMAGSRRGDQRVPAFWISQGRPKLGWCWDRNPHTWLGTASCGGRLAVA